MAAAPIHLWDLGLMGLVQIAVEVLVKKLFLHLGVSKMSRYKRSNFYSMTRCLRQEKGLLIYLEFNSQTRPG